MVVWIGLLLSLLVLFAVIRNSGREEGRTKPPGAAGGGGGRPLPAPPAGASSAAAKPANGDMREAIFAARWLVWLGGAALAFGGGFLVKYSIDRGILGPLARVTLSGLFGTLLMIAGEWLRRRPVKWTPIGLGESAIPPALTAAGLLTCYAAAFGAHALYGLIGPLAAFALLAAVSGLAVLLSLVHGPFIGVLGLAGAYAVPLLVSMREPSAPDLFVYLGTVNFAALSIVRLRRWWWLGWFVLAAGTLWLVLFLQGTATGEADRAVCEGYVLVFGVLFAVIVGTAPPADGTAGGPGWQARTLAFWGACTSAVLLFSLIAGDRYTPFSIASAAVLFIVYSALAAVFVRLISLAFIAAGFALILVAVWPQPPFPIEPHVDVLTRMFPELIHPHADTLAIFAVSAAALHFVAGLANALRGRTSVAWAALSAGLPLAMLIVLYGRLQGFERSEPWSWAAFALTAALAAAGGMLMRRGREAGPDRNTAVAIHAVGATATLSLAFAMRFEEALLSAALALQLPILAWIHGRVRVPVLRTAALWLTLIVIVRLLFNKAVLDYEVQTAFPLVNWITWGYGLSALFTFAAARLFARTEQDGTVYLLQAACFVFTAAFAGLQIRVLTHGGNLAEPGYGLLEASLNTVAWLVIAYAVYRRLNAASGPVVMTGCFTLFWLAAAQYFLVHIVMENPLLTSEPVGEQPLFNLLLTAYGLPALLLALFHETTRRLRPELRVAPPHLLLAAFCAALVLYEGLEIRRFFHAPYVGHGAVSDSELYSYSAVWLVTALAVMATGFLRRAQAARLAGLTLLTFVALKVFVYDMSGLTGLLRVASFMGLGASLIGIGFVYQRFVLTVRAEEGAGGG